MEWNCVERFGFQLIFRILHFIFANASSPRNIIQIIERCALSTMYSVCVHTITVETLVVWRRGDGDTDFPNGARSTGTAVTIHYTHRPYGIESVYISCETATTHRKYSMFAPKMSV